MKVLVTLVMLCTQIALAQGHHHPPSGDRPSVHGMLMVGTEKIYISHLPMFHSPHDYQVILEVELSQKAQELYLKDVSQQEVGSVYTLVPEVFVLPEMVQNPRVFKAQVFRGHFERGGQPISQTEVKISKVIYFKKFSGPAARNEFLLFGNGKEKFLAHVVTSAPDFDQVIHVQTTLASELEAELETKGFLQTPLAPLTKNMLPFGGKVTSQKWEVELTVGAKGYLEVGDLAR